MQIYTSNNKMNRRNSGIIFFLQGLLVIINFSVITCDTSFFCGETFCVDSHLQSPCPVKRNCTTQGNRQYLTPERCNCCEDTFCIEYIEEDKKCSTRENPSQVDLCGPFLACTKRDGETPTCQPISDPAMKCMQEKTMYAKNFEEGVVGTAQFLPQCDAGGRYAQRQCLPGSVCFCTNSKGERIFGVGLPTQVMNCKCAKDNDLLKSVNMFDGQFPRCLPNGNYDELQCVARQCWCRMKPETKINIKNLKELPCYDPALHPTKPTLYLRDCEYKKGEVEIENLKAKNDSVVLLIADVPNCDLDGNFSPMQSRNDKFFCSDLQGKQIANFEIEKNSPLVNKVDCYCARIRNLMAGSANGMPTCCKYGNFRKWQCNSSICYCVDRDGKQIVTPGEEPHEVHKDQVTDLKCYSQGDDDCAY